VARGAKSRNENEPLQARQAVAGRLERDQVIARGAQLAVRIILFLFLGFFIFITFSKQF
jgi:hypothetical protein